MAFEIAEKFLEGDELLRRGAGFPWFLCLCYVKLYENAEFL